jgi:SpoVK/Ycf46/Vps4 family AAA+-type ATPase
MNDSHDLELLIRSLVPIISVETHEEERARALIEKMAALNEWSLFTWSVTEGLRQRTQRDERIPETSEPEAALRHISRSLHNGIYLLFDFHPYLTEPVLVRLLKEIAQGYAKTARTMVLISHRIELPAEIARLSARFDLKLPDATAIRALIQEEAELYARQNSNKVRADREAHDQLVAHTAGLPLDDARRYIRQAIRNDGAITRDDIRALIQAKHQMTGHAPLLELDFDSADVSDVGGLENLKRWLSVRRAVMLEATPTVDAPRGVLLLGVQGSGKSLAAKAIAGNWKLPLLRLDISALYNKFYGETERNLREALKSAENLAPCVLWIDEIEKAIAQSASDDGLSRRLLGSLLTWMTERRSRVFLVATANDIQALPPELLRKGRFDEIFFVDLPAPAVRRDIFAIHLRRRKQTPEQFDLDALATASEGFSGAEIEQAIVSALYQASARKSDLDTALIATELKQTKPLSVVMAERVAALRDWARERAVPAG